MQPKEQVALVGVVLVGVVKKTLALLRLMPQQELLILVVAVVVLTLMELPQQVALVWL